MAFQNLSIDIHSHNASWQSDGEHQLPPVEIPHPGKVPYHQRAFLSPFLYRPCRFFLQNQKSEMNRLIFPITYAGARVVVKKAMKLVGIDLRPHDLRRFAATYASRSGTPIEIVSKVILRHQNLQTTQLYLGKVSDIEATRWIENLYQ